MDTQVDLLDNASPSFSDDNFIIKPVKDKFEVYFPIVVMFVIATIAAIAEGNLNMNAFARQIAIMYTVILITQRNLHSTIKVMHDACICKGLFRRQYISFNSIEKVLLKAYVDQDKTAFSLHLLGEKRRVIKDVDVYRRKEIVELLNRISRHDGTKKEQIREVKEALKYVNWFISDID